MLLKDLQDVHVGSKQILLEKNFNLVTQVCIFGPFNVRGENYLEELFRFGRYYVNSLLVYCKLSFCFLMPGFLKI